MKVLHVIPSFSPTLGGPREAVFGFAWSLYRQGIVVEIAGTGFGEEVNQKPFPLHEIPSRGGSIFPSNFFYSPEFKKWLNLNLERYDLLHIHGLFNYPASQACNAARKKEIPYILRPCGMLAHWALKRSRIKKKLWLSLFERKNLEQANYLHFTSIAEKKDVEECGIRNQGVVIPIGVGHIGEKTTFPNARFTKKLDEFSEKTKILFLSRVHPKKGLGLLIPALGILSKKRSDFVFVLAGGGEKVHEREVDNLLSLYGVRPRTIKTGFVGKEDKEYIFSKSDLFVLPSFQENFGIAVAEALENGLPVVISNHVDIHNDIQTYNAGVVTALKIEEVAGAIEKLLDDGPLRKKMGENGKRLAREKYNWDTITPKVIRMYEQVLSGKLDQFDT